MNRLDKALAESGALNDAHDCLTVIRALANHFIVLLEVDDELAPPDAEVYHLIFMMNFEAQAMSSIVDLPGSPFNEDLWDAIYSVLAITTTLVATWRDNDLENQFGKETTAGLMMAICRACNMVDSQMDLHRAGKREHEPAHEGSAPKRTRASKNARQRIAEVCS